MSSQGAQLEEAWNPFSSASARANSNYCGVVEGALKRLLDDEPISVHTQAAHEAVRRFIGDERYSCVGAKSILNRAAYRMGTYGALGSLGASSGLARDLCAFVTEMEPARGGFCSFIAVFQDGPFENEARFEEKLWAQLNSLHELDRQICAYDPAVSSDPSDARFAFSFARTAMFVVGLHPGASRVSRRFPYVALIFNPHQQFRAMRENGQYDRFKNTVRVREMTLQGSLNPNLSDFGERSEARQYAGRPTGDDWTCPFRD